MATTATIETNEDDSPTFFPLQSSWLTELDNPPAASPVHNETQIFVSLRNGSLVALSLTDGSITWTADYPTRFSPIVTQELVVIANNTHLVGLNISDAEEAWTINLGNPVTVTPLLENGWLVVTLKNGELVVLRASDGVVFWREQLDGQLEVQPSIGGNTLFVPVADGRIIAFNLRTGQKLWEYLLRGSPRKILPLDALFVGSTDNFMYRLSRQDGSVEWMARTGADIVGSPAADERRVFFVSLDNVLRALDRKTGNQQWRTVLPGRPIAGPTLIDRIVLISGVAPQLRAFDTETGDQAGVLKAPTEFAVMPQVIRSPSTLTPGLIVTTGDGRLTLMEKATGPPQFSISFPPRPLLPVPELLTPADVLPASSIRPNPIPDRDPTLTPSLSTAPPQASLLNILATIQR